MRIYQKRGVWYLSEVGKDIKSFSSEQEARIAAGTKCEDCECEPCECDKVLEDVEDVEPVKVKPKADWNLKNEKRGSAK